MRKKKHSTLQILSALRYLEQCGKVSETAKKYGVSRQTIYSWQEEYKEEYKKSKTDIEEHSLTVEAQKLMLKSGTAKLTQKTLTLFEQIIEYFSDNFDEKFKLLDGKQQVALLNTIMPYVLERKGTLPPPQLPDPKGTGNTQNNFFLNIIQQMRNGDNEDNIRRNIETITASPDSGRETG